MPVSGYFGNWEQERG